MCRAGPVCFIELRSDGDAVAFCMRQCNEAGLCRTRRQLSPDRSTPFGMTAPIWVQCTGTKSPESTGPRFIHVRHCEGKPVPL